LTAQADRPFASLVDANHAIASVQGALRIPSVFGDEGPIADYLSNLMRELGYTSVQLQEVQPGRRNLIGRVDTGRPGPTLVLQGHMDTVPAGQHPEPFSGALRDDRIWGRGASDMKGPLVAAILAVAVAGRAAPDLAGSCIVIGTVDEESEKRGIFELVDGGLEATFGINVEPTDLRVAIAQKGCVSMRVTTHGVAAHGANPSLGVNAIERMAGVIDAIQHAATPSVKLPGVGRVESTYNVGVIRGGSMFFIVPDECSIWVDRRTVPGETQEDALRQLRETVSAVDETATVVVERQDWNWERIQARGIQSCSVDHDSPIVQAVMNAVERVRGEPGQMYVQSAWCETDFLVNDLEIPTVNFGPGRMELAHTSDEHIEVASLLQGIEALALAVADICRGE
jgi:acetylornithine deacetylase/succinyl-diaminopimelate desuccinylase family protein